jgi:hypothetical protein
MQQDQLGPQAVVEVQPTAADGMAATGTVSWNGAWDPRNGPVARKISRTSTQTLQSLRQLQQQTQGDPAMAQDVQALIRDMQRLNPNTYANDPLLAERIQAALISNVQQVEMQLRRKVDDSGSGSVRSPGGEKVPQGYADAVAEYYRKLSKGKP